MFLNIVTALIIISCSTKPIPSMVLLSCDFEIFLRISPWFPTRRSCLKQLSLSSGSKYTILTTHLYTCVITINITLFNIYFNKKHWILIY